MQPSCTHIHFY